CNRYITPNVPTIDSGTEIVGMTVAQPLRKKRKITITTSATVNIRVNSMSWTEARIVIVRSEMISRDAASGREVLNSGKIALILSTVLMILAPGSRPIDILTDG